MLALLLACVTPIELKPTESEASTTDSVEGIDSDSSPPDTDTTTRVECGEVPADDAAYQDLYDVSRIHTVVLDVSPADQSALAAEPDKYVPATLTLDGTVFPGVGIRWRGEPDQQRWDGKPGFKIAFRSEGACETYGGLLRLSLDAQWGDAAQGRLLLESQALAAVGEAHGLEVPKVAWTTVQVNGEDFGLYTSVETVDEQFLVHHGLDPASSLYEGGSGADFSSVGAGEWNLATGAGDEALLALLGTTVQTSGEDFYVATGSLVNLDQVLDSWALMAAMGDGGSFPYVADDAYLYLPPGGQQLQFLPWSADEGWSVEFGWNYVDTEVGLHCIYDDACSAELKSRIVAAAAEIDAFDLPSQATSAFALSDAAIAADSRRGITAAATRSARTALIKDMGTWPALLLEQIKD